MSINFFEESCQSKTHDVKFGLCDDGEGHRAYIDDDFSNEQEKWIAIVENNKQIEVTFTAIDYCIQILKSDGKMAKRCDGMLTYDNRIIFVELKERSYTNSVWIEEGDKQLRTIINIFKNNHNLTIYTSKKAYIANRKKPNFQYSHKERMRKFRNETGFTLLIQNLIKL